MGSSPPRERPLRRQLGEEHVSVELYGAFRSDSEAFYFSSNPAILPAACSLSSSSEAESAGFTLSLALATRAANSYVFPLTQYWVSHWFDQ